MDISIVKNLQPLKGSGLPRSERWHHYVREAHGGILIGVYDNGISKIVVNVAHKKDFDNYEAMYSAGMFLYRDYYSVPKEIVYPKQSEE